MKLSAIYEPVQEDLAKVEDKLRSVSKVDFSHLSDLLDYSLKSTGKRIRPVLTLLSGKFYDYNLDYLLLMAMFLSGLQEVVHQPHWGEQLPGLMGRLRKAWHQILIQF